MRTVPPLSALQESQIPVALIRQIRERNVHVLVGSGLSVPIGFPSWEKLIFLIYEKIQDHIWSDNENREWLKNMFNKAPDWAAEVLPFTPGNFF
jgi:hypothetical protein